jgi:hypothetical protein
MNCFKCVKKAVAVCAVLTMSVLAPLHPGGPSPFAGHSTRPAATAALVGHPEPYHDPPVEPSGPVPTVVYSVTGSPI